MTDTVAPKNTVGRSSFSFLKLLNILKSPFVRNSQNQKINYGEIPEKYNMEHEHRGYALIFNHSQFNGHDIVERRGTEIDRDRLVHELIALGFNVLVYNDLEKKLIIKIIKDVADKDHENNDCLVVAVMSHGTSEEKIYAKDGPYTIDNLWKPFMGDKCKQLAGKPKLFFIQACRGTEVDKGIQVGAIQTGGNTCSEISDSFAEERKASTLVIPKMADFLIMYSTYYSSFSFRNPLTGSWFIQCLCDQLEDNDGSKDIMDLLTGVTYSIAYHYQGNFPRNMNLNDAKQCPMIVSMLTKTLYLLPRVST